MVLLRIDNDYSYVLTSNQTILDGLWNKLRFRKRNYFHDRRYKAKIWDGFIDFFGRSTGKFLTGLLPDVKEHLALSNIEYTIEDLRKSTRFKISSIDDQFLNQWLPVGHRPITLEKYQVDFVNQAINDHRGVVQAPTAAGKSYIMVGVAKALGDNVPTLVLGNRRNIVTQNYNEFANWGFKNLGKFDGTTKKPNVITCATVQSLGHLKNALPYFKALIVDEVHLMMSKVCLKYYRLMKKCDVRIAVSATPFKYGGKDLVHKYSVHGFFGQTFKTTDSETGQVTAKDLQKRKRLSDSECHFYYVNEPDLSFLPYTSAVEEGIAKNYYFHQIIQRLISKLKGRTLILVERLEHGDALHSIIPGSLWIQGKDDDNSRQFVIQQLTNSEHAVAIATSGIFDVGVNFFVHNLINCASGDAEHVVIQRIGRGLRPAADKITCKYYDFIFTINEHLKKHSNHRIKILDKEGHKITIHEEYDF